MKPTQLSCHLTAMSTKHLLFFELSFGGREAIQLNIGFPAAMLQEINEVIAAANQVGRRCVRTGSESGMVDEDQEQNR